MAGNFSGLATREIYQKILDFIYLALVPLLLQQVWHIDLTAAEVEVDTAQDLKARSFQNSC